MGGFNMRAIPKKLLIHSATIKGVETSDRWGNEPTSAPINLTFVRVEPSSKIVKDKQNNDLQLNAIMFFDAKNSQPNDVVFTQEQIIVFNGIEYNIQTIEPLYDDKKLHHYELGLI